MRSGKYWLAFVLAAPLVQAQSVVTRPATEAPQSFATTSPRIQKVVVEQLYYYTIEDYTSSSPLAAVTRSSASADSPEQTVIALISAMKAADFEWFRGLWTAESRKVMEERDQKLGRGPGFWVGKWREVVQGKQAILTHRIRTGEYVLIEYKLVAIQAPKEEEAVTSTAILKKVDGKWFLTQDLASDPVASSWSNPETPIKVMARVPPK